MNVEIMVAMRYRRRMWGDAWTRPDQGNRPRYAHTTAENMLKNREREV